VKFIDQQQVVWRLFFFRMLGLLVLGFTSLQIYFLICVAAMNWFNPGSTSFERTEAWRLAKTYNRLNWKQEWQPYEKLPLSLKKAAIVSEDGLFAQHHGVYWDSIEKAWQRNAQAQALAERLHKKKPPKLVGGSTITQQLAKNLFLSGERFFLRKAQELLITLMLEACLSKQRILEIYLNHVEWGEGVFGAQAAAIRYFDRPAIELNSWQASRLVVMLPSPKYFEKIPQSAYLSERANVIESRFNQAILP